jgi:hypothetical protein
MKRIGGFQEETQRRKRQGDNGFARGPVGGLRPRSYFRQINAVIHGIPKFLFTLFLSQ